MSTRTTTLPKPYHEAVLRWRDLFIPDYGFLLDNWEKHFPKEECFRLCAHREVGMCGTIECGERKGEPKYTRAQDMDSKQAAQLLGQIRAQASTEFGSIQQHRLTLARAQQEEEQVWVLRMMADELRHGYQMLHLLMEDDWSSVTQDSSADMVEEILSMTTGSHLLSAFNIEFDSFVDNIVFCGLIDRVGKFQLAMQKVSAYQPMAESMPRMLREEAFHLATGVVPMRRWVTQAARGEVYITMEMLQKAWNKWLPRGLEMFGHEKGGGSNVRYGLKPMKNAEAQDGYYEECGKVIRDLNMRYLRARLPELSRVEAGEGLKKLMDERETFRGVKPEDLLRLPDKRFFRRRGEPAFELIGVDGGTFEDAETYLAYLAKNLPESYLAGSDFRDFTGLLRRVHSGETTPEEAARFMPELRRVGGACPCSRAVRWVQEEPRIEVAEAPSAG